MYNPILTSNASYLIRFDASTFVPSPPSSLSSIFLDLTVLSWLDQNSSNSASNSKGDRTQVHGTKLWFYTDGCMASFSSEASFIFIRCLAYGPILFLSKAFPSKDSEFWERIPFILQVVL